MHKEMVGRKKLPFNRKKPQAEPEPGHSRTPYHNDISGACFTLLGLPLDIILLYLLVFSQVGCKTVVCPEQFKTQKYCDMLREICPEIESSTPGDIKSAR